MIEIISLVLGGLGLAFGVFVGVLGDAPIARYAVARAVRKLPPPQRPRYRAEWEADFAVLREQPLRLLLWALGLTITTRALAAELGEASNAAGAEKARILPGAATLPSDYALRARLELFGIEHVRLRSSLVDHGVHD